MKFPHSTFFAAATVFAAISTQAASINWTANNASGDGTGDVSLNGTLVEARNGNLANDRTVNGVTFQSVNNSAGLFDSVFRYDNISSRAGTGTSGAYNQFLRLGQRSGLVGYSDATATPATEDWTTVNFTGLTVGNQYEIQIWAVDTNNTDGNAGNNALVLGDGTGGDPVYNPSDMSNSLLYEYADGATSGAYGLGGQYGLGTFVADATTQSFNARKYNNLLTSPSAATGAHFSNGWQLRDLGAVPEASTAMLIGLAGFAFIAVRRRN